MASATDCLAAAAKFLGYKETPVNKTIFGEWYGLNGSAWCGMFVSYILVHQGVALGPSPKGYAYTPAGAAWFQKQNLWNQTPAVGAIVFYKFGSRIDHTGIVESFDAGSITAIEGNTDVAGGRTGGQVMRKHRARGSYIAGYGHPTYASSTPQPSPVPEEDDVKPYLITNKDTSQNYLVHPDAILWLDGGDVAALSKVFGPPIPVSKVTFASYVKAINADLPPERGSA